MISAQLWLSTAIPNPWHFTVFKYCGPSCRLKSFKVFPSATVNILLQTKLAEWWHSIRFGYLYKVQERGVILSRQRFVFLILHNGKTNTITQNAPQTLNVKVIDYMYKPTILGGSQYDAILPLGLLYVNTLKRLIKC